MNDLIRRDDVIQAIHGYWGSKINELPTENTEDGEIITDVRKANEYLEHNKQLCLFVKLIKTVEVAEPKRGRWIPWDGVEVTYKCSVCGADWDCLEGTPMDNEMYYCPNCGARME